MNLSASNNVDDVDVGALIVVGLVVTLYVGFGFDSWPLLYGGKNRIGFVLSIIYVIHLAV